MHLKHGKDADANLDYAGSRDVQLDDPIVPKPPPWWTQDFVRTGVLQQGPRYFAREGTGGSEKRVTIALISTPAGDQKSAIASIDNPYAARVHLRDSTDGSETMVPLHRLWTEWQPAD